VRDWSAGSKGQTSRSGVSLVNLVPDRGDGASF
jgi:hypothetical protein